MFDVHGLGVELGLDGRAGLSCVLIIYRQQKRIVQGTVGHKENKM